jgi:hypothetical protein
MLDDFIPLTFDYKTSRFGHSLLEKIVQKRCEQCMLTPDLGLTLKPGAVLKIAVDEETMWMLPGELYAIEQGLEFGEEQYDDGTYRGYYNEDGEGEGVGVKTFNNGNKHSGEYKRGKRNGVVKAEFASGDIYWGQYKDGLKEGYGTCQWKSDGEKYTG